MNGVTIQGLCRVAGLSRQAYYHGRRERRRRDFAHEEILEAVHRERRHQPRAGARKLQALLQRAGLTIGRDRLFAFLRNRALLVAPKRKKVRTTYHDPALPVYRNLLYELEPTQPHQVWVSSESPADGHRSVAQRTLAHPSLRPWQSVLLPRVRRCSQRPLIAHQHDRAEPLLRKLLRRAGKWDPEG